MTELTIPKLYTEKKTAVLEMLKSADRGALMCDDWTLRATYPYVPITSHFISNEWALVSNVLQTRALHESRTVGNIANLLKEAINEWGSMDKVRAIVTDNAANMLLAVGLIECLHVGCFAHTLNLASQAALKIPAVSASRESEVHRHFTFCISHALKNKQTLLDLTQHQLVTDVPTCWKSALEMLERFLKQQPAVSAALLATEVQKQKKVFTWNKGMCSENIK